MSDRKLNPGVTSGAINAFGTRFGAAPELVSQAPGRVNLIGEHVDYNDGIVLPMAIERLTAIAARTTNQREAVFWSRSLDSTIRIDLESAIEKGEGWGNYVLGVLAGFLDRGYSIPGFEAVIESDVPIGGGLSSSAALEVAVATLLEGLVGISLSLVDKARLCQEAEHRFAGMPCGIMDQLVSAAATPGHLMRLDCRDLAFEAIPFQDAGVGVLIIDTGVHHALVDGAYAERRRSCEAACQALGVGSLRDVSSDAVDTLGALGALAAGKPGQAGGSLGGDGGAETTLMFRRARHVVTEIGRAEEAAVCAARGDWEAMGALFYRSHESMRDDFEISCEELDAVVEMCRDLGLAGGVYGCRMTGGGFGGCVVALVQSARVEAIERAVGRGYQQRFGRPARMLVSRPAGGARVVSGSGCMEEGSPL